MKANLAREWLWPLVWLLILLAVWETAGSRASFLIAGPSDIVQYSLQNAAMLVRALGVTLLNASIGFVLGNLVAVGLAAIALLAPRSERLIKGLALLVFCLPLVATGPILRVVTGPGPWPQIILAALAVYYTTLIPVLVGLRALPSGWLDLVKSYGRGQWAAFLHVRVRASTPYLAAGLQIAAPAAFLGAMVGEFTGAERGMGVLTIRAMQSMDVAMTWSLAAIATLVAMVTYWAIGWLAQQLSHGEPPVILAEEATGREGWMRKLMVLILIGIAALALWQGTLWALNLNSFFAKGPIEVYDALLLSNDAADTRAQLGTALAETGVYLLPGYIAGLAAGAALAMVLILLPSVGALAMPLAIALRSVPIITTAPLVVLVLGRGAVGTITLVAVMVFFPSFVACLHGLRQAPGQALDVMRSYAATPVQILRHVRLPAMLPAFFAAARMSVPACVLAVTVVEWLASGRGIGSLMAISASLSDYDMLWSSVVVVAVLSMAGYGMVAALERAVLRRFAPEQVQ